MALGKTPGNTSEDERACVSLEADATTDSNSLQPPSLERGGAGAGSPAQGWPWPPLSWSSEVFLYSCDAAQATAFLSL